MNWFWYLLKSVVFAPFGPRENSWKITKSNEMIFIEKFVEKVLYWFNACSRKRIGCMDSMCALTWSMLVMTELIHGLVWALFSLSNQINYVWCACIFHRSILSMKAPVVVCLQTHIRNAGNSLYAKPHKFYICVDKRSYIFCCCHENVWLMCVSESVFWFYWVLEHSKRLQFHHIKCV